MLAFTAMLAGSSPRVRGKRLLERHVVHVSGLIPARAGKTRWRRRAWRWRRAHPRACGENGVAMDVNSIGCGSSPRVRGKQLGGQGPRRPPRIIPARAGKTASVASWRAHARDHPRACGENPLLARWRPGPRGSSPRVRGKLAPGDCLWVVRGIIPARAGKTLEPRTTRALSRDHPRACGENMTPPSTRSASLGSSPRVRGKLEARRRAAAPPRRSGSSPRVRGKRR